MEKVKLRYPGPNPFSTEQENIFFGREQDIHSLYRLSKIEPLVVCYSKSGLGKSSLLNAGLIPLINQVGDYYPVYIRFTSWTKDSKQNPTCFLRDTLLPDGEYSSFLDKLILNEQSIWHALKELQITQGKKILLIFDQFEELFTYPSEEINSFKSEIKESLFTIIPERYREILENQLENDTCDLTDENLILLEQPIDLKIILAIRSDKLSLLNNLSDFLPTILKSCFELLPLDTEKAKEAIIKPSQFEVKIKDKNSTFTFPFVIEDEAVLLIINYLTNDFKTEIESTQLQIICQSIEKQIKTANQIISKESLGNLNEIIENYYYDQLNELGNTDDQLQAQILIEEGLIFEEEQRRISLYEGQIIKKYKIAPGILKKLVDAHLLRAEPSLQGGYVYELCHDTLIEPILKSKKLRVGEF